MAPRLKEKYNSEIRDALRAEFKHANPMEVGGLTKIVVNMGVGEAARDSKALEGAIRDLTAITGQKPQTSKAARLSAHTSPSVATACGSSWTASSRLRSRVFVTSAVCPRSSSMDTATTPLA